MPDGTSGISPAALQNIYEENFAPWVQEIRLRVTTAEPDRVSMLMQPPKSLNRQGDTVSGQALVAAADTVMVLAIFAAFSGMTPCATVDMTSSFLKPATNVDLFVTGRIVRKGRSLVFCSADIASSTDDKLVLTATGTYALPPPRR